MNTGLPTHGFRVSDQLQLPRRHCRRPTTGNLRVVPSTTPDWCCLPRLPTELPSRAVARCGSADN